MKHIESAFPRMDPCGMCLAAQRKGRFFRKCPHNTSERSRTARAYVSGDRASTPRSPLPPLAHVLHHNRFSRTKLYSAIRRRRVAGPEQGPEIDFDETEFIALMIFESFQADPRGRVDLGAVLEAIADTGIDFTDSRISFTIQSIESRPLTTRLVDLAEFTEIVKPDVMFLERVLEGDLVVPDWEAFSDDILEIFKAAESTRGGKVATYIPQLSKVDPELYSVSVCTVDGQRLSLGNSNSSFCVQSCCKPVTYSMAVDALGVEGVLEYIGFEPSGQRFDKLVLNDKGLPHNACLNAGGLMSCALVQGTSVAERFAAVLETWKRGTGGAAGFDNPTFLSEKATADKNFCLAYMLKEAKAFPKDSNVLEILDLYFMCCSISVTCPDLAVMGATLANGGVCPTTQTRVFKEDTAKTALSSMYSCGMYDYSGQWAFSIGIPAKSGVAGAIMASIPGFGGIAVYSPRLSPSGNSVRGVEFFRLLTEKFNFHHFELLALDETKKDPRKKNHADSRRELSKLIYAASEGNVCEISGLISRGIDPSAGNQDGRTALHVAAAENQLAVVRVLLAAGVDTTRRDRWGNTPLDDAIREGHVQIQSLLE